MEFLFLNFCF
jgi:regulator of chromosome condensation